MLLANMIDCSAELKTRLADYDTDSLGNQLSQHGVVHLSGFLPRLLKQELTEEADELLSSHGRRVDVRIQSTGNTPRKYVSVSRNNVFEHAPLISQLYSDSGLIQFLAKLARSAVITCPYEPEQIVVNKMNEDGDTHGWHWDDYSYSLVLVLEAPERQNGAQVEYVDGTSWDKASAQVQHYLDTKTIQSLELASGSAYVLLGKRVMHRVSPLKGTDTRKIICFSYATEEERYTAVEHGSMEDIYG
ncbi:HalD/BesD family halogenase [Pseudomonas sp.]|uniref:HalD/BesD family halogenase n=1 Tax=Pseudomonas sp. TaxID=306 RepID=UPI003C743B70